MKYAEEDYLMLSGIQHFQFLSTPMGFDSYRATMG